MRITPRQAEIIRQTVASELGSDARIWLFGSRADDSERGGDIDLFIESMRKLDKPVALSCRIASRLQMALGDQRIDVLLADPGTPRSPIQRAATGSGVRL